MKRIYIRPEIEVIEQDEYLLAAASPTIPDEGTPPEQNPENPEQGGPDGGEGGNYAGIKENIGGWDDSDW